MMAAPSRHATLLTAPTASDGVRIPRAWSVTPGRAVRITAPPPDPPPRRRRGPTHARCASADANASAPLPPPSIAHTVRLATQADLPALESIERECGNPAWGVEELQVREKERVS